MSTQRKFTLGARIDIRECEGIVPHAISKQYDGHNRILNSLPELEAVTTSRTLKYFDAVSVSVLDPAQNSTKVDLGIRCVNSQFLIEILRQEITLSKENIQINRCYERGDSPSTPSRTLDHHSDERHGVRLGYSL